MVDQLTLQLLVVTSEAHFLDEGLVEVHVHKEIVFLLREADHSAEPRNRLSLMCYSAVEGLNDDAVAPGLVLDRDEGLLANRYMVHQGQLDVTIWRRNIR